MANLRLGHTGRKLMTLISNFQKCLLINYVYYSSEPIKFSKRERMQKSILIWMVILLWKSVISLMISCAVAFGVDTPTRLCSGRGFSTHQQVSQFERGIASVKQVVNSRVLCSYCECNLASLLCPSHRFYLFC